MRKLLDAFKGELADFVEQRNDLLMLITCTENEAPITLKLLQDVEQENGTDVFLLFADDFIAPGPYVDVAIERLREQHQLAGDWLAEQDREPLPPLPEALGDQTLSPVRRLGMAMMFARSLLPREGGHRLVWTMVPQHIHNRDAYLDLISNFIPKRGLQPGMQGLRLIFRDEDDTETFKPELADGPRVRTRSLVLNQTVIRQALEEEAEDETQPDEQRMQALLSVALFDYAHQRSSAALEKLKVLLGYYQHTENTRMQAFVINTAGDVYQRDNQASRAQHCYECAVPLTIESKDAVGFHTAVKNLADLAFAQQDYPLAEQHYDSAQQIATQMLDPEAKIRDLERRGLSQEHQNAHDRAVISWEEAATLARSIGLPPLLHSNLEHLQRGYRKLGQTDQLAAANEELQHLATPVSIGEQAA